LLEEVDFIITHKETFKLHELDEGQILTTADLRLLQGQHRQVIEANNLTLTLNESYGFKLQHKSSHGSNLLKSLEADGTILVTNYSDLVEYSEVYANRFGDFKHMKKDIQTQEWTTLGSRNFVLGRMLFEEMTIFRPYEEITKIKIPLIIIHGDKDTKVPYKDSKEYINNPENLVTIINAEHGFHEKQEFNQATTTTISFFKKYF